MTRRTFLQQNSLTGVGLCMFPLQFFPKEPTSIGIIGLDTSHSIAFTKLINAPNKNGQPGDFKVTHAYPHGSKDIESSVSRIPQYTKEIKELGVSIAPSIEALLAEVKVILLETNDGRLHLEQAKKVIAAKKTLFIDKPMAASLKGVVSIFELAKQAGVPIFSSSSLRFSPSMKAIQDGKIGTVLNADTYSPAKLEKTHPDLFWYGIHGVESLFTLMGTGCKTVRCFSTSDTDVVVGEWEGDRIGTFRGLRNGKTNYGGTAYGTEGIATAGIYEGYQYLVAEILQFFKTGIPPVTASETIEIFAFMEAAQISKKKGGKRVRMDKVLRKVT